MLYLLTLSSDDDEWMDLVQKFAKPWEKIGEEGIEGTAVDINYDCINRGLRS